MIGVNLELNFPLAWRKTKRDYHHYMNSFVSTPYIVKILDSKSEAWFSDLQKELKEESYKPRGQRIIEVPKSNFHLRPASGLYIEDHLVYSALLLNIYDDIKEEIEWSAYDRRFSHILFEDKSDSNRWEKFERDPWQEMQEGKIALAKSHEYVLQTDISGFYENIEIQRTCSKLREFSEKSDITYALKDILETWAEPRKRGIPQGYGASDVIAESYLDSIDRRLYSEGITHIRYNDDFFVFTDDYDRAIQAQNLLERLMRERGLNMKSGKTGIITADEALEKFKEPESVFEEIRSRKQSTSTKAGMVESASRHFERYGGGYLPGTPSSDFAENGSSSDEEIDESKAEYSVEVLEEFYEEHIMEQDFHEIDGHLFRYLINRLGNVESEIAVEYCKEYIIDGRPDVRRILYVYFQDLPSIQAIADDLSDAILNKQYRYNYHEFVTIRWIYENELASKNTLNTARYIINKGDTILESRDYSVALLSEHGSHADLELIEAEYSPELRPVSKAVFAYALRNLEPTRRGKFYERIDSSNRIVEYGIERGPAEV